MELVILAIIIIVPSITFTLIRMISKKKTHAEEIKWQQESEMLQKQKEKERQRLQMQEEQEYGSLQQDVLKELGIDNWDVAPYFDEHVTVNNQQELESYDKITFFRDNREKLEVAEHILKVKNELEKTFTKFLQKNDYTSRPQYNRLVSMINDVQNRAHAYRIQINYISSSGIRLGSKEIAISLEDIIRFREYPHLLMTEEERYKLRIEKEQEYRRLQKQKEQEFHKLQRDVSKDLGLNKWYSISYFDETVTVKSRQALENYNDIKFFKDNREKLEAARRIINKKNETAQSLGRFIEKNSYTSDPQYDRLLGLIHEVIKNSSAYRIQVNYISSAGNHLGSKEIVLTQSDINRFWEDPSLLMTKGEYSKLLKEHEKEAMDQKQHEYYDRVSHVIDYANDHKAALVVKGSQEQLDGLIGQLFDRTVNTIKRIKTLDSEEWKIIGDFISHIEAEVKKIVGFNQQILAYYESPDFLKIKETCAALMSSQREFNEYINEKVQSISQLFGTRVVRSETVNNDEYNYIRPYKKTITPFTAEVSAAVFASAENNPLEYVVKKFYPNKREYPEQIRKLQFLVGELETLREAKQIIENYKADYQQYLGNVPDYIMQNDEDGFYSRLGFAIIDESVLCVEYKFSYTSNGGMAQRSFPVPMTEETIAELIKLLQSKLTASEFAKEQRAMMTKKMREHIKQRDNFTCCICGNSTHVEPNLLLEIDHIIPVSKGGSTVEDNLQTLCWKCNRAKSDKILN